MLREFDNKDLTKSYKKNGYTVNVYKPFLSEEERLKRDIEIKNSILKIISG